MRELQARRRGGFWAAKISHASELPSQSRHHIHSLNPLLYNFRFADPPGYLASSVNTSAFIVTHVVERPTS
jgi:hypothetical protein